MRWYSCLLLLTLFGSVGSAQTVGPVLNEPAPSAIFPGATTALPSGATWQGAQSAEAAPALTSNHNFSNFIGFMSNPLQNIDPRSLTQVVPIFGAAWVSTTPALPSVDGQIYGPALSVALTDRFSVGVNQGGYASLQIDRGDRRAPLLTDGRHPLLAALAGRIRDRGQQFGGRRDGFLNTGGFAQYTFFQDVENQFLATAGLRVVVPIGSYEVFQGKGPAILAPYLTVGKELGDYHVLATGGYQFPARTGDSGTQLFYLNAHLDRQCFGWIYPLVEANWSYHTTSVDVALPTRRDFIDFGNFESTGNVVTLAAGVNFVLIRDKVEFGAVYARSVATQHNVDINSLIVKMVFRF